MRPRFPLSGSNELFPELIHSGTNRFWRNAITGRFLAKRFARNVKYETGCRKADAFGQAIVAALRRARLPETAGPASYS